MSFTAPNSRRSDTIRRRDELQASTARAGGFERNEQTQVKAPAGADDRRLGRSVPTRTPVTASSRPKSSGPLSILHGLCTYGIGCEAIVGTVLDRDAGQVASYRARFAGVVYPGETLKANIWKEGDGFQAIVTAPERDDAVALAGEELIPA